MNNNGPFAREGYPFIACSAVVTLLLSLSAWKLCSIVLAVPAAVAFLFSVFILYFFRNP